MPDVDLDLGRLTSYGPALLGGTITTLALALVSMALASALGLALAAAHFSGLRPLVAVIRAYIAIIRNTPELVQIFFVFYSLPRFGIVLSPFLAAVIVFSLHYAAYLAEVFRGGIASIERGQWEASRVLGLSRSTTWLRVVMPQVVARVIPPWGNYLLILIKATSLASAITVGELTYQAQQIAASNFRYFELFTLIGLIYLILSLPAAWGLRRLETYLRRFEPRALQAEHPAKRLQVMLNDELAATAY
jgi:polar amino acid transport system permease protein